MCVVALGVSLGACETFPENGYGEGYGYDRGPGRYVNERQCYEVRTTPFSRPYIECREVKRWKSGYTYAQPKPKYYYRDRDRDRDREEYDEYSHREPKRRYRDREYYD
jgi:hypothetical protein